MINGSKLLGSVQSCVLLRAEGWPGGTAGEITRCVERTERYGSLAKGLEITRF